MLLWRYWRHRGLWANAEAKTYIPLKFTPPSTPSTFRPLHQPNFPKRLEGPPRHKSIVWGNVRQCQEVDSAGIPTLLPSYEIAQLKGMYSFVPRSPLLRLVCEAPDSNRNWKSRYFFMEGDGWMNRPGDNEFMLVDTTWGILQPFGMYPSILG